MLETMLELHRIDELVDQWMNGNHEAVVKEMKVDRVGLEASVLMLDAYRAATITRGLMKIDESEADRFINRLAGE